MSLDDLRRELGEVDRQILALVAQRQGLAKRIGQAKREAGLPTRDFRQERDVLSRARDAAQQKGLAPALGEELLTFLIKHSLTVQEKDAWSSRGAGTGKRALVLRRRGPLGRLFPGLPVPPGGAGAWGGGSPRSLAAQGFSPEVAVPAGAVDGVPSHADWRALPLDHDVIVLATPLGVTAEILAALAVAPPRGLVFDVGSLKSPLRAGLRALAAAGARVTSVHPMFGPDTEMLSGRHVIFTDVGVAAATAEAKGLFATTMATLVDMDLEQHDRLIAYVLGLSHAVNLAFFTALAESGEAAPRLAQMSSTTFDAQLDIAGAVASENPDMFFEIQALNDYGTESLGALLYAVERVRSLVRAGDGAGFAKLMAKGREYLSGRAR